MPEISCESEDNMAALYQWVVTIDGYTIHTDQFVCRKGANAWEFPACPSSACEDDECTICTEGWEKNTQWSHRTYIYTQIMQIKPKLLIQ